MKTNTVIIGSGIAGMTAAIYLNRANIDFIIVESSTPGGQILRTSTIENYPGFKEIDGPTLAINIYKQLSNLNVKYCYDNVEEIIKDSDSYKVKCNNTEISCKNIIVATGRSPRKLGIENEEKFIGKGISFCAICDGSLYKDKNAAVIGGGNSAFEESLYLSNFCNKVTIIVRSDTFRADETLINKVKNNDKIKILTNRQVKNVNGNDKLESITLDNDEVLEIDGMFIYIGQVPNTKILKDLNILNDYGYIKVDKNMKTDINNIYACGDCIDKDLYQIITAASDGAIAANQIIKTNNIK